MDAINNQAIRLRYELVMERIAKAAHSSGRRPEDVRLVVVTKLHPPDSVRAVAEAGARVFGENYADEAVPKIQALQALAEIEWHMIGHVQSRKSGLVVTSFAYLHSLDSLKLAERLDRQCAEIDRKLPVLLEFNISGEESKSGFIARNRQDLIGLLPVLDQILALPHLDVRGLMTMPPYYDQPELARPFFVQLRTCQAFLRKMLPRFEWNELSMGMSGDFEVAIQEGATWVRIGTSILGPRPL